MKSLSLTWGILRRETRRSRRRSLASASSQGHGEYWRSRTPLRGKRSYARNKQKGITNLGNLGRLRTLWVAIAGKLLDYADN
ncbi:hypothetical protein [Nostoc sp. CALU 1950]|uniref:hypothetical protein n=1 Tax=Nostoc sp. CALU 1950 TaxID=3104321 RepID=UPI003EBD896B